jgi:hypothetical protein
LILYENFCKWHNVPPPSTTIKEKNDRTMKLKYTSYVFCILEDLAKDNNFKPKDRTQNAIKVMI